MDMKNSKSRVLIVGTKDVDARIELMRHLHPSYDLAAVGSNEALRPKFTEFGLPYYVYPLSRGVNPWADLQSYHGLVRIFRKLRPTIVHTFDTKPCVWGRLAAHRAGVPVIVGTITGLGSLFVDSDLQTRLLRAVYQPLQRLACRRSHLTIFYNREDFAKFVETGMAPKNRCALVPGSGLNTNHFRQSQVDSGQLEQVKRDIALSEGEVVITLIARVCRCKGVLEFAQAADIVKINFPRVRFVLVGPLDEDGQDRLTQAEIALLRKSVTWLGERQDIAAILAASDICVLPTFYCEGIPRVLMEAASMGLPLITTDAPGCREVVRHGVNGFLIPPKDVWGLALGIARLACDENLRKVFGAASRQLAVTEFDIDIVSHKISEIYRHCLRENYPKSKPTMKNNHETIKNRLFWV